MRQALARLCALALQVSACQLLVPVAAFIANKPPPFAFRLLWPHAARHCRDLKSPGLKPASSYALQALQRLCAIFSPVRARSVLSEFMFWQMQEPGLDQAALQRQALTIVRNEHALVGLHDSLWSGYDSPYPGELETPEAVARVHALSDTAFEHGYAVGPSLGSTQFLLHSSLLG